MAAFISCAPSFEALRLKYDSSRVEFFQTQCADNEGFMTDLGCHLFDVQSLSAEEGIQLLQDCIMTAAPHTYDTAKASSAQPRHKPWVDSECRAALRRIRRPNKTPPVTEAFLKQFRTFLRRHESVMTPSM